MQNLDVVRDALLKYFTTTEVEQFMVFVQQDKDLLLMIDRNPQKAVETCKEILRIALDKSA